MRNHYCFLIVIAIQLVIFISCATDEEEDELNFLPLLAGGGFTPPASSLSISYTNTADAYFVGTAIPDYLPTVTGGVLSSFSANAALVSGLSLNTSTGKISGTPTTETASNKFQVTVTDTEGNTATISGYFNFHIGSDAAHITCNTSGIASGCISSAPYACPNSTYCYTSVSACRNVFECASYL